MWFLEKKKFQFGLKMHRNLKSKENLLSTSHLEKRLWIMKTMTSARMILSGGIFSLFFVFGEKTKTSSYIVDK